MRTILLCISYRGTNYKGFQKQKNTKETIQEYLQNAIKKVFCEDITVTASGRTDAGVHALMQYVSFNTTKQIKIEKVANAINTYLPKDILILDAMEVPNEFNARFSAKKKTYRYVLCEQSIISPFNYDLVAPLNYELDEKLVKKCIEKIKGKHNFKAFSSSNTSVLDFTRTIFDFKFEKVENSFEFEITGDGFLYNMVRIIIGTIIDIARGKLPIENIDKMFETGDRSLGGKTAGAEGLYLANVEYL